MAKKTTENIGLELPETTDFYDVEVVNNNNGLIDRFFANLKKKIEDHINSNHVTGVKGNDETTYRSGNVNVTAENIGLGNVDNTADNKKVVKSAAVLTTGRSIDGVIFNGNNAITHYAVCSTAGSTAAKTVTLTSFALAMGANVTVRFANTNTVPNPTLHVNGSGAYPIYFGNRAASAFDLVGGEEYKLHYNAQYKRYEVEGAVRNASSYSHGLMSSGDKMKLDGIKITGTEGDLFGKMFCCVSAVVTESPATINAPDEYIPIAAINADWNAYPEIAFDIIRQGGFNLLLTRSLKTGASDSGQYIFGNGGRRRANILFVNRKFISGYDV